MSVELVVSVLVVVLGSVMTTVGAFTHGGPLVAPGAALILLGASWLGNVLARRNLRFAPWAAPASDARDAA